MQTWFRFQIVKQKGKRLLPRVYIDKHEKCEHSSYGNMINVSARKLRKLLGQNSKLLLDRSKILLDKKIEISLAYSLQRKIFVVCHIQSLLEKSCRIIY